MNARPRLLFVCTGNTGRSVSAESLMRLHLRARDLQAEVFSRGLGVDPLQRRAEAPARELLRRRGVDLSGHLAQGLQAADVEAADLILCVTREHRDRLAALHPEARARTFSLADYAGVGADLEDAYGQPIAAYEAMLAQLESQIPAIVERFFAKYVISPR